MTRKSPGIALLAIAASAVLAVAGCGTTKENAPQPGQGNQPQAQCGGPGKKYTIGMSQANRAEPYRERMDDDIRKAAAAIPQFDVKFQDAAKDNTKQVEQVDNFITQKVDLLIISPNEATPLTSVVKKAYDQKIPVVVLDRKVDGEAYTTWIGADNVDIGRQAGQFFATQLMPNGGKVLELRGLAGSTPAKERGDGFRQGIQGKNIEIVASADGDWERDIGQRQAEAMLKAHPDVNFMYSHNDPMAEAAYIAAQQAGRTNFKVTGIDGLPIPSGGIKAVEAGRLAATLLYPTGGKEGVETAKKLLIDCQQVPKTQTLPTQLVTKENAAQTYLRLNQG